MWGNFWLLGLGTLATALVVAGIVVVGSGYRTCQTCGHLYGPGIPHVYRHVAN